MRDREYPNRCWCRYTPRLVARDSSGRSGYVGYGRVPCRIRVETRVYGGHEKGMAEYNIYYVITSHRVTAQ